MERDFPNRRVIRSARLKKLAYCLGCLVPVAAPFMLETNDGIWVLLAVWLASAFFGSCLILLGVSAIRGLPLIVLNRDGLTYTDLMKSQHWDWDEVGPFEAVELAQKFRIRMIPFTVRTHFVSAHINRTHALLESQGIPSRPRSLTEDVVIPISLTAAGKNLATAKAFAAELNRWRDHYGHPLMAYAGSEPDAELEAVAEGMETRHKHSLRSAMVWLAVVIIVGFVGWGIHVASWRYLS